MTFFSRQLRRYVDDPEWPWLPWTDGNEPSDGTIREFIRNPENLEVTNEFDETLLSLMARTGRTEIVSELLDAEASPGCGAVGNLIANSSTDESVKYELVRTLLKAGAAPDQCRTREYGTPLGLAAERSYLSIVKLLLASGARDVSSGMHFDGAVKQVLWSALNAHGFRRV